MRQTTAETPATQSLLTGVYQLDVASSDRLYRVVAEAASDLPEQEQQRLFEDLSVRLTSPDLLVIERRGRRIQIASSRAARIEFIADGVERAERGSGAKVFRTRAVLDGEQLTVSSSGSRSDDRFTVVFEPTDNGQRLRVTRRIHAAQLDEPIVIQNIYHRISDVPRWNVHAGREATRKEREAPAPLNEKEVSAVAEPSAASALRQALEEWMAATNARDIERQMGFYLPTLDAFYLARNLQRSAVRAEKERVFRRASMIDIRAGAPEIILSGDGRTAIMRFRKQYRVEGGAGSRRGEVIQELRWRLMDDGWKISSERDVKVIR